MKDKIEQIITESVRVKNLLVESEVCRIAEAAQMIINSIKSGGKLLLFGNGGSAADSQHMAAELVGRFKKERVGLPAIALTTNTSSLTAIANDYSYESVFSRQIEALGKAGDVAVGISTSGDSKNVTEAARKAKRMGLKFIALTGGSGGVLAGLSDLAIVVPSKDTPRIQECHLLIIHILCELVENGLLS